MAASLSPSPGTGTGAMSVSELADIGQEMFGAYGWQTRLAKASGIDGSTIRRYISGRLDISRERAEQLRTLLARHREMASSEVGAAAHQGAGGWYRRALALVAAVRQFNRIPRNQTRAELQVIDDQGHLSIDMTLRTHGHRERHFVIAEGDYGLLEAEEALKSATSS